MARPAGIQVPQISQQTNFSDFCFGAEAASWKWRRVLKNSLMSSRYGRNRL